MPIPKGLCSHCGKDFNNCECPEFHPNLPDCHACAVRITIGESVAVFHENCAGLRVRDDELKQLLEFFYTDAGYIGHDKYNLVHQFINRLENYAKENQKDSSETSKREETGSNL